MKVKEDSVKSSGLSLLYEPDAPTEALVDIVLVHGIGGHPVRSWKYNGYKKERGPPQTATSATQGPSLRKLLRKNNTLTSLRRSNSEPLLGRKEDCTGKQRNVLRKDSSKSRSRLKLDLIEPENEPEERVDVYWPLELLPASCPHGRVFTWGYHTLVVDRKPLRLQYDIFAHARELLIELAGIRDTNKTIDRPIVFIAHSTGGLLVKEVLRLSDLDTDGVLKPIVLSTLGVIFMACPQRASENSKLSEAVRNMASITLKVEADDIGLKELSGSKSIELELGRQAFVRIWNDYNFKVKTYQESLAVYTRFLEDRGNAVVRRQASFIGDHRENAETVSAKHVDICKFASSEDPTYRSLANTLVRYIRSEGSRRHKLNTKERECFAALARPYLAIPETLSASSYPGTCLWLYDMPQFRAWHHRSDRNKHKLLWIKGKSGCGKTVLLKSLRTRLEKQWGPAGASFIWATAEGHSSNSIFFPGTYEKHHETNPAGVYRSLLAQLFHQDPRLRKALLELQKRPRDDPPQTLGDALVVSFFSDDYIDQKVETPTRRTFVFVDVADDAGLGYLSDLISHLSRLALNSDFSVCVASTHHAEIKEDNAIDVVMPLRNADDILRYVNLNLVAEWEERSATVVRIGQKAGGVFLWAEIVVNILNAAISEGASQELIEYTLEEVPDDLHGLYEWMLATLNDTEKAEALVLFQWVMLAAEPLRLNDLLVAVRLTEPWSLQGFRPYMALQVGEPSSMRDLRRLRNSEITSGTPYQFHRWIRSRSIGLLELKSESVQGVANEPLGLQRVYPIHDSVRSFFRSGRGFACLAGDDVPVAYSREDLVDVSHYSLLRACLRYLNMRDFERLGQGNSQEVPIAHQESRYWQQSVFDQRNLVMSSFPFLQYAVDHLLFHLLNPQFFRYFLPQHEVLAVFSANRCRLWRRWTSLLGSADTAVIFAKHSSGPAADLLSPVFGARYRLERVFRKLSRLSGGNSAAISPVVPITPVSASEKAFWSPQTPRFRVPPTLHLPLPPGPGRPGRPLAMDAVHTEVEGTHGAIPLGVAM
ncbi:hypothetical protein GQ53DRAFT_773323 [Thozetella sp. PMI_491]|nr:hypothetical protein GQ53DRAFT_773323 [Thozetella sp. PMI_491]